MNDSSLIAALDELVPVPADAFGDWDDVLARARATIRGRRALAVGVVAAALVVLFATPAFGLLRDLIGRIDVPFGGSSAPLEVKRQFFDLSLGLPPAFAPQAIPSQARRVGSFRVEGKTHVLWVAPTTRGGYCYTFSRAFGGCRTVHREKTPSRTARGAVHPELLGVTFQFRANALSTLGGDLLAANASSLEVVYADGTRTPVRFYYVSKPIDAGFFYTAVPPGHQTVKTRAIAVVAEDKAGQVVARQPFFYETASMVRLRAKQQQAMLNQLRRRHRQLIPPRYSPALPAPTAPLQHGQADGITALAGRNGVVIFDTTHATSTALALIRGPRPVEYNCFRRLPYHSAPVELGAYRTTTGHVAIRPLGMTTPFMGCEIQGTYGHRWPDRLHGHSAVEIAFTPAARTYFADRAAARDLALFVRSKAMHAIRKLSGSRLAAAIHARYDSAVVEVPSAGGAIAPGRIRFIAAGATTTFVETSSTGRRFFVRVEDGRIVAQNVKPLGFVF